MGRKIAIVSLALLLLAVCAGSIVAIAPAITAIRDGRIQWNWFSASNFSADTVEEKAIPAGDSATVVVHTPNGRVEVTAKPNAHEIALTAHKTAWGLDAKSAQDLLQKVVVKVEQTGGKIDIQVDYPVQVDLLHIGPAGIQVDFTLTVPPGMIVDASSSRGDVLLHGPSGDGRLQSDFGDIFADNVPAGLTAHSNSGKVVVEKIGSPNSMLVATSGFGDVVIRTSTASSLQGGSESGSVSLYDTKVGGLAELTSSFGDVRMKAVEAGSVKLKTSSGTVTLEDVVSGSSATAQSDFGDILCFTTAAETYDLKTSSGKVQASGLRGTAFLHSSFGDLVFSGENVLLDAGTNSGSVTFTGSLANGMNKLKSDFGDVTISLPEGSQFHLDLSTSFGHVHSEFPVTTRDAGSTRLVGDVGSGGPSLTASTSSGNVEVRILAGAPATTTPAPVE
jgi:hypothetical protein